MSTRGFCDNCGKERHLSHGYGGGLETWQCWECRGSTPECDVCGEELEKGKCTWCYGDPWIDRARTLLQKIRTSRRCSRRKIGCGRRCYVSATGPLACQQIRRVSSPVKRSREPLTRSMAWKRPPNGTIDSMLSNPSRRRLLHASTTGPLGECQGQHRIVASAASGPRVYR